MKCSKRNSTAVSFLFMHEMANTYLWSQISRRDEKLNQSQAKVLRELRAQERMNLSNLAVELSISNQAMTTISNFLVKKGYVKRVYNESNRRQIELELTDKGLSYVNDWEEEIMLRISEIFSVLSEEDCENLAKASNQIYQILAKTAFGTKYQYKKNIELDRRKILVGTES